MRQTTKGTVAALASMAAVTGIMLPFRHAASIATTALVLVVPVVVGVVVGGFVAGLISVAAGFLVYDYFFIPPYEQFSVGRAQNWVALAVYAAVMLLVAAWSPTSTPPGRGPGARAPSCGSCSSCRRCSSRTSRSSGSCR
jgi:K+-sensing histidine kinase KdpD